MILEMKVPSPGESITEVEIAQWLVSDGDYVEKDQAIAEVDSDKATLELPAEESGTITLKAEEGDAVEVGAIVCLIDTEREGNQSAITSDIDKVTSNVKTAPKVITSEQISGEGKQVIIKSTCSASSFGVFKILAPNFSKIFVSF